MRLSAVLLTLVMAAASAAAQDTLPAGTLVRIRLSSQKHIEGRTLAPWAPSSTTLVLCGMPHVCRGTIDRGVLAVALDSIVGVEQARGTHLARGALIGAAAGTVIGVAAYVVVFSEARCVDCVDQGSPELVIPLSAAVFTVLGAATGAGVPRWRPVAGVGWRP
jgi:hypothetical protein